MLKKLRKFVQQEALVCLLVVLLLLQQLVVSVPVAVHGTLVAVRVRVPRLLLLLLQHPLVVSVPVAVRVRVQLREEEPVVVQGVTLQQVTITEEKILLLVPVPPLHVPLRQPMPPE